MRLLLNAMLGATLIAGCKPGAPGPNSGGVDDRLETHLREVRVPGRRSVNVLYGRHDALMCRGKHETVRDLLAESDSAQPYADDYYFVDVTSELTSYRAIFQKSEVRSPNDATFVFCSGAGAELDGKKCTLVGVLGDVCFEAPVLDAKTTQVYAELSQRVRADQFANEGKVSVNN